MGIVRILSSGPWVITALMRHGVKVEVVHEAQLACLMTGYQKSPLLYYMACLVTGAAPHQRKGLVTVTWPQLHTCTAPPLRWLLRCCTGSPGSQRAWAARHPVPATIAGGEAAVVGGGWLPSHAHVGGEEHG